MAHTRSKARGLGGVSSRHQQRVITCVHRPPVVRAGKGQPEKVKGKKVPKPSQKAVQEATRNDAGDRCPTYNEHQPREFVQPQQHLTNHVKWQRKLEAKLQHQLRRLEQAQARAELLALASIALKVEAETQPSWIVNREDPGDTACRWVRPMDRRQSSRS
jgi:hypothetical protein